ncbi:30S ribosomal protein S9 [Infirmifilum sp. NZ]|uniref:30S ribosomal protein S9 n=1 Tax=Infirmifilum sp. NZ TaxID=2926850 RepID=UPI000CC1C261|nr:30S ribosomal protein S9 [Infirmifilum sp. NZ]PLJ76933.1 MAG: 30S ribosomal protein S9 [Thermofilum sp. NZ13]UNQ74233.1 30S ribosomal protein S9 [Infirmifilum sp. NZ]
MRVVLASARRKTARARVIVKEGKGRVLINGTPLEVLEPEVVRLKIMEPIMLAGDIAKNIDIYVESRGGGVIGQASAIRTAIARAILEWSGNEELKKIYLSYDRHLLVEDPRQAEPKKPHGRSARAKRQKSYR